jgi:hypothetical protein
LAIHILKTYISVSTLTARWVGWRTNRVSGANPVEDAHTSASRTGVRNCDASEMTFSTVLDGFPRV